MYTDSIQNMLSGAQVAPVSGWHGHPARGPFVLDWKVVADVPVGDVAEVRTLARPNQTFSQEGAEIAEGSLCFLCCLL
jgi:hypothetical protein